MNNNRAQAALLELSESHRLREAELTIHSWDAYSDEEANSESPLFNYFYNQNEIDR